MTHSTRLWALLVLATCAATACLGDSSSATSSDSAGVRIIVHDDSGSWTDANRPQLVQLVDIGGSTADTNLQFGAILGADVGADGSIYVLDATAGNIRAFDSTGNFLRRISRRGSGPGEISPMALGMFLVPGDTILVPDIMASRTVVRFTTDGTHAGDIQVDIADGLPLKWVAREDGMLISHVGGMMGQMMAMGMSPSLESGMPPPRPQFLQLRDASGKVLDTLLTLPSGEMLQSGGEAGFTMRLFAPEPMWAAAEDGTIFYGANSEYSVNVLNPTGELVRIVRRTVERTPITDADAESMRNTIRDRMKALGMDDSFLSQIDRMIGFADYFPAIGGIMAGPDGTLWVQRARTTTELRELVSLESIAERVGSTTWDVFDKEGAYLGKFPLPTQFTPMKWVGDKLLGVFVGGDEVPKLVVYRLSGG